MGNSGSKSTVTVTHSSTTLSALLLKRKPSRKPRTIQLTVSNLMILQKMGVNLADVNGTLSRLMEGRRQSTVGTYVSAIINYLDALETEGLLQSTLRDKLIEQWRVTLATLAEGAALDKADPGKYKAAVEWDKLKERRDSLRAAFDQVDRATTQDEQDAVQKYLVACLYTMIPPMRNDYGEVMATNRATHNPIKHNWVWTAETGDTGKLIFNHYKTSGTHGAHTIIVPMELAQIINMSFHKFPRSWLLVPSGAPLLPLGDRGTARLIHRAFDNCYIGPTMIRHSLVTAWSKAGIGGLDKLAKAMCHSLDVSQKVYNENKSYDDNPLGVFLL